VGIDQLTRSHVSGIVLTSNNHKDGNEKDVAHKEGNACWERIG
jgi:hypothetical protein